MAALIRFRLIIQGPDGEQKVDLPIGTTSVGRDAGNDVVLIDPRISRWHAQVACTEGECWIKDFESANGTLLNEQTMVPQMSVRLHAGDVVRIGFYSLIVEEVAVERPLEEVAPPQGTPRAEAQQSTDGAALDLRAMPPVTALPQDLGNTTYLPEIALESRRLLNHLPDSYHTDFMARFMAIFESILMPIEWNVDNFDLCLDPGTAPVGFLPWLSSWFLLTFDATWSEEQRRTLLKEAHLIYARRGTAWALRRVLEIYTGTTPTIADVGDGLEPFTFRVQMPVQSHAIDRELLGALIEAHKPAHTTYVLE